MHEGTWGPVDAARYIGCTTGTLRCWVSQRRVPFVKVNTLTRFRKRDLDQWLDSRAVSAQEPDGVR
jgi:excisionase family DNA binding protein